MNTTLPDIETVKRTASLGDGDVIAALRATTLFSSATASELAALAQACRTESWPAENIILQEGSSADDLYLLLSGELLVYAYDDLGNELPLARFSEAYQFVGEQAFLSAQRLRRSASVRTVTPSRLLRVPGTAFEDFLSHHQNVATELIRMGSAQIREKVSQQMSLLRFLDAGPGSVAQVIEMEFADQALICTQGEVGQHLYVVLAGTVHMFRTEPDGRVVHLARLQQGQSFGELSLIEGKPRLASGAAEGAVRVLAISADAFKQAYLGNQQVRDHVAALRGLYSYGGEGIALQFTAEIFKLPAIGTLFKLKDGRTLIAHRVIGQNFWSIQLAEMPAEITQVSYTAAAGVERTLLLHQSKLVGATIKGPWPGIGALHHMVLDGRVLVADAIDAFRRSGEIDVVSDAQFVCQCMRVSDAALQGAMTAGCHTVQALSARTGAGTVCGGCVPKLAELTNENLWQAAVCIEIIERTPRVKSFRFKKPAGGRTDLAKPGQHIVLQAKIDGTAVHRPYTLTSPITEKTHYEITVLRQESGLMSNWLFDNLRVGDTLALLPPSGTFLFDLADARPLVCIVGGIGATPAMAICRSAMAMASQRRIHVDYSVAAPEQTICAEEWNTITERQPNITTYIRDTRMVGRIDAEAVAKMARDCPGAEWLICGSALLQAAVKQLLQEAQIPPHRMHIESFLAIGTTQPGTAVLSSNQREALGIGLLIAVALFIVQALAGVKWPLPAWMQTPTFSILTGLGLMALFVMQWKLGYVRLKDRKQDIAHAYRIHIWLGPAIFGVMLLHSTTFGFALSLWLSAVFIASLASGALLGINPRSANWEKPRQVLLGSHIVLSCAAMGFALAHGIMSVWYS